MTSSSPVFQNSPFVLPRPSSVRPLSRPSSRSSISSINRSSSPAVPYDDPVAIRSQLSILKHSIRQQQGQYQHLENILLRTSRSFSFDTMSTSPPSPVPTPISVPASPSLKALRRTSYEHLHSIAGPNSSLPLPNPKDDGGIQEGVPMSFASNGLSPNKRASSPTRTLSRIPVSSVDGLGNARALADDGQPIPKSPHSKQLSPIQIDADSSFSGPSTSSASLFPPSPNKRASLTPGGTTKVLADLQTGVINARNALENTKSQLRISQRAVAQLTRQTEDLKEGRERMRLENESLNIAMARKERLLQEMLERARKAEAEAATLKAQLKQETTTSKKSLRDMETSLGESKALSQKSEREYITLRDSLKQMAESWKADTKQLRAEMQAREEKWKKEAEEVGTKYRKLVEEVDGVSDERAEVKKLKEKNATIRETIENVWIEEIRGLKEELQRSQKDTDQTKKTAENLAEQLARLRRLMSSVGHTMSPETSRSSSPELPNPLSSQAPPSQ